MTDNSELEQTSRPATLADMQRAWPDKTPEELDAALAAIQRAGGVMSVVTGRRENDGVEDEQ